MATVELRGVSKSFGSTPVLSDIELTVGEGEFLVLVGPSGCGKSTLLRVIAGLDEVDSGDVLIGDKRVNDLPPAISLQIASTSSDGQFFAYLEDVAPDGRVTYITEGQLRALHRRIGSDPPYWPAGRLRQSISGERRDQ